MSFKATNVSELFQLDSWSYLRKHQTYTERASFCPTLLYIQVWVTNLDTLETQSILQSRGTTAASQAKHQHFLLLCWLCNSLSNAGKQPPWQSLYKPKMTSDVTSTVDQETATRLCFPDTASCRRMQNSFCVEGKSIVWLHVKLQLWEDDSCELALSRGM